MSMYGLALRALLFRGRTVALALLPLGVGIVAVAIGAAANTSDLPDAFATMTANLLIALVVALVALVLGVNAFDDEREGGTFPLLLATTTRRWRITGARIAGAWTATVVVCLPATIGCGLLGMQTDLDSGRVWASLALSTLAGSLGYVALFVLLSLLTRRSLLIGLAYIVVWEGVLAGQARALRNLSVGAYGRRILTMPWDQRRLPFEAADPRILSATLILIGLAVVAWLLASRRLQRINAVS